MSKEEFENIVTPKVNNGIAGGVSPVMWAEIEFLYMNTDLEKIEVADLFWNRTGLYEQMVAIVKDQEEAKETIKRLRQQIEGHEDRIAKDGCDFGIRLHLYRQDKAVAK